MRRIRGATLVGIIVGLVGAATVVTPYGHALEEALGLEWLFRLRGPIEGPDRVVVAGLDRTSLDWLRTLPDRRADWPERLRRCLPASVTAERLRAVRRLSDWPRHLHGCAVDVLEDRGAAAIVFDIAFVEARAPDADSAFAEAIARSGRVALLQLVERISVPAAGGLAAHYDLLVSPIRPLAEAAAGLAPFPLPQDAARVSRFWLFKESVGGVPTLPVVASKLYMRHALASGAGRGTDAVRADPPRMPLRGVPSATAPPPVERPRAVPGAPDELYLNFYGPPGTVTTIPYHRLLQDEAAVAMAIAGKIVFIGVSDLGSADQLDRQYTVFRRADAVDLSGVEIAASATANLLSDEALRPLTRLESALVALVFGLVAARLAVGLRGPSAIAAASGFCLLYLAAASAAFAYAQIWAPLAVPFLLQLPLALGIGLLLQHAVAVRWLGTYLPRSVAEQLLHQPAQGLARQEHDVTVMFTDIAGFAALSQSRPAEAVARLLNAHFALVTACIEREGGIVDKYLGDGLLAVWGVPVALPDHAQRGARAALAISDTVQADNARRRAAGLPPIRMRIGIHSGPVTVGDIGGAGRRDYTVVGDTVNIGQRLEQLGKQVFPEDQEVCILVSETTAAALGRGFRTRPAGIHRLRGRAEPTTVFVLA